MKRFILVAITMSCLGAPGFQQTKNSVPAGNASSGHRLKALRAVNQIKIDGVLNETAWTNADVISDFRQEEPVEGEPATEKTEIRVLSDSKYIYFGIRAFDSEPKKINARELVRDASLSNDDKV